MMNQLPNYEPAVIEDSKLVDYALNPNNERGQHKAQVFARSLGFDLSNWERLKREILIGLPMHKAASISETDFGRKCEVVIDITGPNGRTVPVKTIWQYDRLADGAFADAPRLVTMYIV